MLQSVEAIVEPSGAVHLLESLHVKHPSRAVVTLLDIHTSPDIPEGNACGDDILRFLEQSRLSPEARLSMAEINAQIEDERSAWD